MHRRVPDDDRITRITHGLYTLFRPFEGEPEDFPTQEGKGDCRASWSDFPEG